MNIGIIISILAGFSTMIGVIPIFFKIKNINRLIVFTLSFSSGIMLFISLFDLLPESIRLFSYSNNIYNSLILFLIMFIIGIILSRLINNSNDNSLYKVGFISMIAIIMHNIPEGILTYFMTNIDKKLGVSLGLAISMHNIPEGLIISLPIYYSTNSRFKAIIYTLISSLSEPFGAIVSSLFFKGYINYSVLGLLISLVCGIMFYISIFELIKEALCYKEKLIILFSFLLGLIFSFIVLKI